MDDNVQHSEETKKYYRQWAATFNRRSIEANGDFYLSFPIASDTGTVTNALEIFYSLQLREGYYSWERYTATSKILQNKTTEQQVHTKKQKYCFREKNNRPTPVTEVQWREYKWQKWINIQTFNLKAIPNPNKLDLRRGKKNI